MKEEFGVKGGKKDRKLSFLNRKRKRKLKDEQQFQEKEKKEKQQEKKKEEEIILAIKNKNISKQSITNTVQIQKQKTENDEIVLQKFETEEIIDVPIHDQEKNEESSVNYPKKVRGNPSNIVNSTIPFDTKVETEKKDKDNAIEIDFIEKQIIQILEQDIQETRFQLKKVDSEIHTIQKTIDTVTNEDELDEIEKEIQELMDMLEKIKKQIFSLEKTFSFKFPVEVPDNYLIHLIDEYKSYQKENNNLNKKLQDNKEYRSLIDAVIEVEEKQQFILEKTQDKKEQLGLEEEQIEKLNNNIIDIEEINQSIKKMMEQHKKVIEEIRCKVNETVHITERVEYITKSVNHTMLELFLLMSILKHNLSIKNNAIAAATAALTLNAIIKMTTPIQEKVVVKDNDFKDYENMIHNCMNDTNFLDQLIYNNLNQISSIRYTFEKDYQSCSYLSSYQEALKKLSNLEDDMKERQQDVTRMKKDMELQLEKNNAKVKKYGSVKAG